MQLTTVQRQEMRSTDLVLQIDDRDIANAPSRDALFKEAAGLLAKFIRPESARVRCDREPAEGAPGQPYCMEWNETLPALNGPYEGPHRFHNECRSGQHGLFLPNEPPGRTLTIMDDIVTARDFLSRPMLDTKMVDYILGLKPPPEKTDD